MENGHYDQLIHYVCNSADCTKLAPEHCFELFQALKNPPMSLDEQSAASKAVRVFFSPSLAYDEARRFAEVIEKVHYVAEPVRLRMLISFLDFAVFDRRLDEYLLHTKLIATYLEALKPETTGKGGQRYVAISKENAQLQSLRAGLVRVLDESDCYDPHRILGEIPVCLWEERVAAYRRAGNYDACLDIVAHADVDLSIALAFCDKVYVADDPAKNSIYTRLFFALQRQAPNQDKIRDLLNSRAERLDPVQIVENIPKEFQLQELTDFLSSSSLARINRYRALRIRNALLEATIEAKKVQRGSLQGGKVEVNENLICAFCGRQIGESVFFVLDDNSVAHTACNPARK
jgi:hypothetical protein